MKTERQAIVGMHGMHTDMSAADYFADPCPEPSLTQSIAKVLLEKSPAHAWQRHPRLNPNYRSNNDKKFDIGNAAHALLLGRGKLLVVVDAEDWRGKPAREARDRVINEGKVAILTEQYEHAWNMARIASDHLEDIGLPKLIEGNAEVVLAWREDDLWCRTMLDWLSPDRCVVLDLKTTAASAAPMVLPAKLATDGWDIQAAMHARGLDVLNPENAGRRRHLFICQETVPPYALTVSELTEGVMTMGRKKLDMAVTIWRHCIRNDSWPGYPAEVLRPEYPPWAEAKWLAREVEEAA